MSYSYITNWISKADAQAMVKSLINEGKFKKGEIKLSSYRWADLNDHSKGYLARVHVLTGLHPEMELGPCGRKKKGQVVKSEPVEEIETVDESEFNKITLRYHNALQNDERSQVIEIESDMTQEQIELLRNDVEGQGHEIALSLAEDFNIDEFDSYELVA